MLVFAVITGVVPGLAAASTNRRGPAIPVELTTPTDSLNSIGPAMLAGAAGLATPTDPLNSIGPSGPAGAAMPSGAAGPAGAAMPAGAAGPAGLATLELSSALGALAISTGASRAELPIDAPTPPPPPEPPAPEPRARLLIMRPAPLFDLPVEFKAWFLLRSRPLAAPLGVTDDDLVDQITDLRVQLRDPRNSPDRTAALRRAIVALHDQRAHQELKPAGNGTYRATLRTFTADIARDGSVHIKDRLRKLDVQDVIMNALGHDPYARNKLAFLDRTRDQRAALIARYTHDQLSRSAQLMKANIDWLWATTRDPAARRAGLFDLWDECAETGDPDLVAGGTAARSFALAIIRARFTGKAGYSAAELARLNAHRQSQVAFAP